jgi:hypothetical protein
LYAGGTLTSAEPLKLTPLIAREVVSVAAEPEIEPVIVLLKVLEPAKVCVPVVTTPEALAEAEGIATAVKSGAPEPDMVRSRVGPAVVPALNTIADG